MSLAVTTSDINGDYRLAKSGSLTCTPGCSCALHIEEEERNGYPAVSASSSSGGTPNGTRFIDFTWRTSGTHTGNNFVVSRVSKRLSTYGSIWRSYYPGAMRVEGDPTRDNNGVQYMLADHLGSTSVTMHLMSDYTLEKRAELLEVV